MPAVSRTKIKKATPKSKTIQIDFSSTESAFNSVQWKDADDWLQEAERQESNGERYQHGPKALRHYQNAIISYSIASKISPSFESLFNAARVHFILATDHVPNPIAALGSSIAGYRAAIAWEQQQPAPSIGNVIDAYFNLGEAMAEMANVIEEGAAEEVSLGGEEKDPVKWAMEAKVTFEKVEELQRSEMERVFSSSSVSTGGGDLNAEPSTESGEMEMESPVGEYMISSIATITPSQIIDTLYSLVTNDLSLLSLLPAPPSAESVPHSSLISSLLAALSRLEALGPLIPAPPPNSPVTEQQLTISLLQLSVFSTLSIPPFSSFVPTDSPYLLSHDAISSRYQSLIASSPTSTKNPSLQSEYADYLLESYTPSLPLSQLSTAEASYLNSYTTLLNRLSPPKNIPNHWIPSLLSSNLASRANIYLLLYHHHTATPSFNAQLATQSLSTAKSLASEAFEITGTNSKLSLSSTQLQIRKPNSLGRTDYRTKKAEREAFFLLGRILMREGRGAEVVGEAAKEFGEGYLRKWVEGVRDDGAWKAAGEGVEEQWWRSGGLSI